MARSKTRPNRHQWRVNITHKKNAILRMPLGAPYQTWTPSQLPDPSVWNRKVFTRYYYLSQQLQRYSSLTDVQDFRRWTPTRPKMAKTVLGTPARVTTRPVKTYSPSLRTFGAPKRALREVKQFVDPRSVLVCARRKMRREVLHALRKAGKRGQKTPRRNYWSDVHC